MPDETTILSLPLILPAQAQKHVTHNEALAQLDLIVQLAVISRVLTTAPVLPVLGDRYIVAAGASGVWAGQSGRIALFSETGWQFTQPLPGWQAHVLAEGQTAVYDGLVWETLADGPLTVSQLGVSASPDATNRLSVSAPATLLNHAGSGHQLKLNKAAAADTASLLFQTGFSGRAEMGTAGTDGFSVKVSADGAAWSTALTSAPATGEVTLPNPVHLGGQASDPVSPPDGTLWLNTTTGEVKVRSAGATASMGGGVSDGDKGDVTVSGGGATWTIDPGAVTLAKLASIATDSFLGRDSAGTGVPEVLTPAQARGILNVADGANNYVHPNHSGDVNSTGDGATVIAAGAVTFAKLQNIGTDTLIGRDTAGSGDPEAIAVTGGIEFSGAGAIRTAAFTGDVTKTAGGTALTIAADAVTNAKLADMATARIKGRTTAGTGDPEDLTGAQATALLDTFTSGAKGLVPASGGGTTNFLRADGTFAAPPGGGGGGSPGGTSGEVQFNNAGAFAGAADVEIEGGQLRLPYVTTPATPAAGGLKLYGMDFGAGAPAFLLPSGKVKLVQSDLGDFNIHRFTPGPGSTSLTLETALTLSAVGTATAATVAVTDLHRAMPRLDLLVTTAATTAIAGWRPTGSTSLFLRVGRDANAPGGFLTRCLWGPATGVATTTLRGFAGLTGTGGTPTDVEPSTRTNIIGMGWDAADTNIQFMHNDASGTATKIDLGASFPVPSVDRQQVYELQMYSPNDLSQSVSYRVIRYNTTDKTIAAEATGTVTTNLPPVTQYLGSTGICSVGGTSSVVGVAVMGILVAREY